METPWSPASTAAAIFACVVIGAVLLLAICVTVRELFQLPPAPEPSEADATGVAVWFNVDPPADAVDGPPHSGASYWWLLEHATGRFRRVPSTRVTRRFLCTLALPAGMYTLGAAASRHQFYVAGDGSVFHFSATGQDGRESTENLGEIAGLPRTEAHAECL